MITVGMCDELHFWTRNDGQIEVSSDDQAAPGGEGNLVHRAAQRLRKFCGVSTGCRINLTKRIPVGGGMGGGSSDAAAALLGLNQIWGCGLSREQLAEIGAEIGSDVPFFFHAPSAIVCGRGERVHPVTMRWSGSILLVKAPGGVSTPEVYAQWRKARSERRRTEDSVEQLTEAASAERMARLTRNDLEPAVFSVAPHVESVRNSLARLGRSTFRVSGAGSVLFDLFNDSLEAGEFAEQIRAAGVGQWVLVVTAPF